MLDKYEEGFLNQYKTQLQKPKWKFILIYGISWVVLVMAIMLPLEYFVFNKGSFTVKRFLGSVAIWLIGGMAYGWWLRWYLMKKYRKLQDKATETGS